MKYRNQFAIHMPPANRGSKPALMSEKVKNLRRGMKKLQLRRHIGPGEKRPLLDASLVNTRVNPFPFFYSSLQNNLHLKSSRGNAHVRCFSACVGAVASGALCAPS